MSRERIWPGYFAWDEEAYDRGTEGFTALEHGCYTLLLRAQFRSEHKYAIAADTGSIKVICKGAKPSNRVLAKFKPVTVDGVKVLRNEKMAKEAEVALREFEGARERRRRWKESQKPRGDTSGDTSPDMSPRRSRDRPGDVQETVPETFEGRSRSRSRRRITSSLRSDVEPAAARAGGPPQGPVQRPPATPAPRRNNPGPIGQVPQQTLQNAIDHDPEDSDQVELALRVEHLARLEAQVDERPVEPADALRILRSVSTTPHGSELDSLRKASADWIAMTLRACDQFEDDLIADSGKPDGGEGV